MLLDLFPGKDTSLIPHQIFQHGVFFSGEFYGVSGPADHVAFQVYGQISQNQFIGGVLCRTPQHDADTGQKLLKGKGFYQVIVCSAVQTGDPVVHAVPGCQKEDWNPVSLRAYLF